MSQAYNKSTIPNPVHKLSAFYKNMEQAVAQPDQLNKKVTGKLDKHGYCKNEMA
jgi:hypothetical protein